MAAELGPGPAAARADGNSPGDADALTGRAWLAALPGELAAQRRVMAGLADRCQAWPSVRSLLVGCSLGRGAADALSDIDAALGVDAERGQAGADQVATAEAMVVAALPALGPLIDVLRHRTGTADQWARRIFAQFADRTQLDLTVVAQADIEIRRRGGGAPDFIPLYQVSAPPHSRPPDAQAPASGTQPGGEPPAAYAVTGDQVREWAFLGWCALIDADKYLRRGSLWEAHNRLHQARHHIWALWAAAHGALYPWHGLSQVLDHDPDNLPPGIQSTIAGLDTADLHRAARASTEVLAAASEAAARRHPADLPTAMGAYVTRVLSETNADQATAKAPLQPPCAASSPGPIFTRQLNRYVPTCLTVASAASDWVRLLAPVHVPGPAVLTGPWPGVAATAPPAEVRRIAARPRSVRPVRSSPRRLALR